MNSSESKICSQCGKSKRLFDFYKRSTVNNILHVECIECMKMRQREYYSNNKEKIYKITRRYAELHPEKSKEYKLNWYHRNAESERKRSAEKRKKEPVKYRARSLLNNAVALRKVYRKPCEVCGEIKSEGHHEDYSKPLEVKWLCPSHHRLVHTNK